ncbi:hypothetical protein PBCV1_a250aR [Paramecium bursaria Chlorella virus 1]|uniref:Uncharacterized protein n=1 Tax=Paramecium bursaria Chlorella virus 1 TaxID=10506 RepID=F8TU05_PBCV1|nr:hypothetical protein PBCV1_a250aR [Paramecium bursaria Chlorella virus 1]AEI70066.1 hypothetical protein [Paramecium bursaria Chlorella virus 1]
MDRLYILRSNDTLYCRIRRYTAKDDRRKALYDSTYSNSVLHRSNFMIYIKL